MEMAVVFPGKCHYRVQVARSVMVAQDLAASAISCNDENLLYSKLKDEDTTIDTPTEDTIQASCVGKRAVSLNANGTTEKLIVDGVMHVDALVEPTINLIAL